MSRSSLNLQLIADLASLNRGLSVSGDHAESVFASARSDKGIESHPFGVSVGLGQIPQRNFLRRLAGQLGEVIDRLSDGGLLLAREPRHQGLQFPGYLVLQVQGSALPAL